MNTALTSTCRLAVIIACIVSHCAYQVDCNNHVVSCFWLPPAIRIALHQEVALQFDCCETFTANKNKKCSGNNGVQLLLTAQWEPLAKEGCHMAQCIFDALSRGPPQQQQQHDPSGVMIFFPHCLEKKEIQHLQLLVDVVNANTKALGHTVATCSTWPSSPCTLVQLLWDSDRITRLRKTTTLAFREEEEVEDLELAMAKTKEWVDETLCRLRFCPYTASMKRAAVGLEAVNVEEGPIGIRHSLLLSSQVAYRYFLPKNSGPSTTRVFSPAAALASAFWNGVCELATRPEMEVATLLIVAPPCYDDDFGAFSRICDSLLEPSLQALHGQDVVGRAWFHPHYEAALVGHTTILPGHALPAAMVETFVSQYYGPTLPGEDTTPSKSSFTPNLDSSTIAMANDRIRWTPHATINLLRRNQLTAAKQLEATLPNPRPNLVYARNVVRLLFQDTTTRRPDVH